MMTSFPSPACSSRLENWSFAARTLIHTGCGSSNATLSFKLAGARRFAGYLNVFLFTRRVWPHEVTWSSFILIGSVGGTHLMFFEAERSPFKNAEGIPAKAQSCPDPSGLLWGSVHQKSSTPTGLWLLAPD